MDAPTAMAAQTRRAVARLGRAPGSAGLSSVERRRTVARYAKPSWTRAPSAPITLSVMRAVVAATDELQQHFSGQESSARAGDRRALDAETRDLVRRYQAASRQLLRDWLRRPSQTEWRVESSTGRVLDARRALGGGADLLADDARITVAEDQPLHGLRSRFERRGIGVPVVVWTHRADAAEDNVPRTAPRARTAVVSVRPDADRRVRRVRIELLDPVSTETLAIGACMLPLAADFTAPITQALGLERRPAARAYGIRDTARLGTCEGFSSLTPSAPDRVPLILVEGAGHSPLMMAQLANEIAGAADLRRRYQVWLYRFSTIAPLFFAAAQFRRDLRRFHARLAADAAAPCDGRGIVVAHGAGAVLARSLLLEPGVRLWDAVFTSPIAQLDLTTFDRALLRQLFFWDRSPTVDRVIVAGEPRELDALTAGVGARAPQLLLRQPPEFRQAIERIYGMQRRHLRPALLDGPGAEKDGAIGGEPICRALAAVARAADHALATYLASSRVDADAALYGCVDDAGPSIMNVAAHDGAPLGSLTARGILDWLRDSD